MQFESLYGVADAYEAWEVAHPGTSSFSFVSQSVNWQEYPCLRPVCEELFGAACVDKPDVGAGVEAWHFRRTNDTEVVVLWRDSGTSTVDVSSIIQSAGYRVRASESGALQADASTAVVVGAEAIIVTEDVDTDGDSLGDLVETEVYGSDPARSDTDGDGQGDAEEILAGSDLLSPTNYFCINSVRAGAGINVILSWNSGFCKQYSVDQRLSLTGASVRVASGIAATPPLNNHTVVVDSASSFYSIAVH
jgi:hypothetical protein